ncbi:hypothetical protein BU23DRAFT_566902 [Bimuria novae-zelandiae CBS 107.79]|uniref:F-box domain-containing protein n=1 Tax=Bimuria novae-zelandiae CBS 107.79 TaxID=1447943 RepID=A0A6A5VCX8_9PLEO|nr:hypothetical protein BU23DRAFT_566902 [Bimuria novae-zelandiae CBS 107.79]
MPSVGKNRKFNAVNIKRVVGVDRYNEKAAADQKRWFSGLDAFRAQKSRSAEVETSPLLRLPVELRLKIYGYLLYDNDAISFTFPSDKLFKNALKRHAVKIPPSIVLSRTRPWSWYPLASLSNDDACLAPDWSSQIILVQDLPKQPTPPEARALALGPTCSSSSSHSGACNGHCDCWDGPVHGQILRVCRTTYYEALPLLYGRHNFAFMHAYALGPGASLAATWTSGTWIATAPRCGTTCFRAGA